MRRAGSIALLCTLLGLAVPLGIAPASAQPSAATLASVREEVARGLEAQFQAALIRERRLADDRETTAIARSEQRIGAARAAAASARRDNQAALAELGRARADHAEELRRILARETSLRAEVDAFRAEAGRIVATADPAKLEALQRFADGDRIGAWPLLEELTQAAVAARVRAASTVSADQMAELATLREVMRNRGEARAADVLASWRRVLELNPDHFEARIEESRLAGLVGDRAAARAAAQAALRLATTREERWRAMSELADSATRIEDERGHAIEALALARELVGSDPASVLYRRWLSQALSRAGYATAFGDLQDTRRYFTEGLDVARALVAADPQSILLREELGFRLNRYGQVLHDFNDFPGAFAAFEERVRIARDIYREAPEFLAHRRGIALALRPYSAMLVETRRYDEAQAALTEMLQISTELSRADESSAAYRQDVANANYNLGYLAEERGDVRAAIPYFERSAQLQPDFGAFEALASAYRQVDQLDRARQTLEEPINRRRAQPGGRIPYSALFALGRIFMDLGEFERARDVFSESLELTRAALRAVPNRPASWIAVAAGLQGLGWAQLRLGEETYVAAYRESYDLAREVQTRFPDYVSLPENRIFVLRVVANAAFNVAGRDDSVSWREVAGYYAEIQALTPLTAEEERKYMLAGERMETAG